MATLCVSLPSTVVGCRGSDRGQFTGRRLQARFGSSPLGRRFRGGVSKQVNLKVWTVRASLETRQNVGASRKGAPLLIEGAVDGDAKWVALPDIWRTAAVKYGDRVALVDPHRNPPAELTFNQVEQAILDFAEGLRAAGIQPNQTVALFADNSHRWLIADQGILAAGAVNAVRGSRSSVEELLYIYTHSDSVALVIDNAEMFKQLAPKLRENANVKFVVLLWGEKSSVVSTNGSFLKDTPIHTFDEFVELGKGSRKTSSGKTHDKIQSDDVATLVYTSGTTGKPKGVMLTHGNLLHQVINLWSVIQPAPGMRFLTLLPPWHMYERSCEYFYLSRGCSHVYTNVKKLKEDLILYKPEYFVAVPLVFDLLYNGVQKQLAAASGARKTLAMALISISSKYMDAKRIASGRDLASARKKQSVVMAAKDWLIAMVVMAVLLPLHLLAKALVYKKIRGTLTMGTAISGGGSLPSHVDKFLEMIGIPVLNGYGLTETSPVLGCRLPHNNILGTVGKPIPGTFVKVVDPETNMQLGPGIKGLVKARGPQIMKGYYKNEAATSKTIDSEGWLDTGDLGWIAPEMSIGAARRCGGVLTLDGRQKDTIVLLNGENVEPTEIEEAMTQSTLIQHIVVLGQDQRKLGALIVVNKDDLHAAVKERMQAKGNNGEPSDADLRACIREELKTYSAGCSYSVASFELLYEPFTVENGLLTPTMKVKRDVVAATYKEEVKALFK
ncbi:hypothetical protein KC19_11G095400 [Ceratodon purpureus]|uniref:AMP-dependent synthetase/ligase domain-containing protein n=1 Tax=Ceratodon purpureus TaxID=3225 RepID=A0A8T0GIQ1_CERPU|nr:hypothetical protein KC19_11G095400 [Ceratodon purpureus]